MARFKPAVKIYSKKPRVLQFHPSSCMLSIRTNWTKETTSSSINENDDLMTISITKLFLGWPDSSLRSKFIRKNPVSSNFIPAHVCFQSEPIEPRRRRHHQSMRMTINYKVIPRMARFKPAVKIYSKKPRVLQFHPSSCMLSIRTNWTKETTSSSINENDDLMTFHMIHFALALNLWRFDTKIERYACFDQKDEHDSGYMVLIQVCKN